MKKYRCVTCDRVLFMGEIRNGLVEMICPRSNCKKMNRLIVDNSHEIIRIIPKTGVYRVQINK